MNLAQQIAASESVRMKFLRGQKFTEDDFRSVLTPDAELRYHYDEAMKLVHNLTGHVEQLREERDRYKRAYECLSRKEQP